MQESNGYKIPAEYHIVFWICISFVVIALFLESPIQLLRNYFIINTSRSVLVTDYVALASLGSTLVNAAISCLFCLFLLVRNKTAPSGKIIAALYLTIGFSMFGKNMFNTLPLFAGIWLYSKVNGVKFSGLVGMAMVCGTIAPIVSEIAFLYDWYNPVRFIIAYGVGVFIGFIFPVVAEGVKRMHSGFCLYNGGVAGGFIATFTVGLMRSLGLEVMPENFWDTEHTFFLASLSYILGLVLIIYGIFMEGPINSYKKMKLLTYDSDIDDNDYLIKYGYTCYINIGVMFIVSTSLVLLLNIPINGPTLGGIFTVAGFAASGKHVRNSVPVLLGSTIAANFNYFELTASTNSLAILFSTGLAPISGKFGWKWGVMIGFLHVSVAIFVGRLNGGLNLYNNGFAGGYVALVFVPLIIYFNDLFDKFKKRKAEILK